MKKSMIKMIGVELVAIILMLAPSAIASNLLLNAGFDAYYDNVGGGMHPFFWDRSYGSDNQIHVVGSPKKEGLRAVRLHDTGSGSVGLSSTLVEVVPGFNYTASVYVKCYYGPSPARLYLRFYDASGSYLTGTSIGTTSSSWVRLSRTMMAPEEAAYAEVLCYVCSGAETGKVYFDNASLVLADEILANGSFEGCAEGELPPNWEQWDSYNPAKIKSYEGENVLWLSDSKTYRSKGAYTLLPGTPGTPYKCTFLAKKLSASNDNSAFYFIYLDENQNRIDSDGDGNDEFEVAHVSTTTWTSYEINGIAPTGTVFIQILPYYSIAATGVSVFKDIEVVEDYDTYYVSENGTGNGQSSSSPALYTSSSLWSMVDSAAATKPVKVVFKSGNGYGESGMLDLTLKGNPINRILLKGEKPFGTVFNPSTSRSILVKLLGCQNIVLEDMSFTGACTGYALKIGTTSGTPSRNIAVRGCNWYNSQNLKYGATGVSHGSHDITYENCTFERIGKNTGSHMMYNAYNATNVSVLSCYFEDCAGSYVRFRDASDYGVVSNSTFVSTQTYAKRSPSSEFFLDFPVFNDVDPGDETFALYATIVGNSFQFDDSSPSRRAAIRFSHKGYDPTGWNYLMTLSEGSILEGSNASAKKSLLLNNCGIDFDEITIEDNSWLNETARIMFGSSTNYGAISKGWNKTTDVSDIVFEP